MDDPEIFLTKKTASKTISKNQMFALTRVQCLYGYITIHIRVILT